MLLFSAGALAFAAPITSCGSLGTLSACLDVQSSGTNVIATLTNTSMTDALVPTDVLTAAFFNLTGGFTLTPVSAVVAPGSTVLFGTTDPGGVVGGEWAYLCGLSGAPAGCGISSSGLGFFGPGNVFPGTNLQGPADPDGIQYGITSKGDNPATGNAPMTGDNALIKYSVIFTFTASGATFDPSKNLSGVVFQYGTAPTDTHYPGSQVPETSSVWMLGTGLMFVCGGLLFKKRKVAQTS